MPPNRLDVLGPPALVVVGTEAWEAESGGKLKGGFVPAPLVEASCAGLPNDIPLEGCVVGVVTPP